MTPLSDEETEPLDDRLDLPQEVKWQTVLSQAAPSQAASVDHKSDKRQQYHNQTHNTLLI